MFDSIDPISPDVTILPCHSHRMLLRSLKNSLEVHQHQKCNYEKNLVIQVTQRMEYLEQWNKWLGQWLPVDAM